MDLKGIENLHENTAVDFFNKVWETKKLRNEKAKNCQWVIIPKIYIDNTVTFVVLITPEEDFFGWSKFNPKDNNYSVTSGIYKAMSRAVDNMLESL